VARSLSSFPACMPRAFAGLGGYEAHSALEKLGVRPRVDFVYDSYDAVFHRVRRSDAWALFPAFLSTQPKKGIAFLSLPKGELPLDVVAVWPRRRPLNRALTDYVDALVRRLRARSAG